MQDGEEYPDHSAHRKSLDLKIRQPMVSAAAFCLLGVFLPQHAQNPARFAAEGL
jgi:hypothetical protein